jgi:lipopolysaccharide export system permease protein
MRSLKHFHEISGLKKVVAMKVISRYIISELIKLIAICLGVVIALYLVIDFFERIDDFLEAKLPLSLALQYFLLKLPLIVQQGIPMGILMGTLISVGLMARSNELLALKAGGVSPAVVVGPILTIALFLSLTDFTFVEYVVPLTSKHANYIWNVQVRNRPVPSSFSQEKIWYKSDQALYNIRVLHPKRQVLEGVTIHVFDRSFHVLKRIEARRGEWDGQTWIFSDGIFIYRTADGGYSMERFQRRRFQLNERPQDFQHLEKAPEEMTLGELSRYVIKIKSEGYDATRYQVDFHSKIAFPFTPFIMALLGIGVALYQGKHGGIAVGVAISISLAFIYLLIFQFVLRIGYTGNLQPVLAAWIPNVFFGITSIFLFVHARH